jgi:phosphohistidine phosphatase SixA
LNTLAWGHSPTVRTQQTANNLATQSVH